MGLTSSIAPSKRRRVQTEGGACMHVLDVVKAAAGQINVHKVEVTSGCIKRGDELKLVVDEGFRRRARANHTATHLLQARIAATHCSKSLECTAFSWLSSAAVLLAACSARRRCGHAQLAKLVYRSVGGVEADSW
jgi:hypothetical protein